MELLISGPNGSPMRVELRNVTLSLGRSAENDLAYPEDPWLSRYHLSFEQNAGNWFVKDCASRNGTVVNATNLKGSHKMKAGDRIYAGHLTIEVRESAGEPRRPVISFVAKEEEKITREATLLTSLDKVLDKAGATDREAPDASLNTSKVVRALIHAGQELAGHDPSKSFSR